jgi:hypothetical protein
MYRQYLLITAIATLSMVVFVTVITVVSPLLISELSPCPSAQRLYCLSRSTFDGCCPDKSWEPSELIS